MRVFESSWFPVLLAIIICCVIANGIISQSSTQSENLFLTDNSDESEWRAPDIQSLPDDERSKLIRYGRELIVNTSLHLGPKGKIASISNGMDCQNCHLDAGAKPFGNAFSAVASTYPKFRERSGKIETIEFRINECMERSMNGEKLDSASKEMKAMIAYLEWIGHEVPKGERPVGSGLDDLPYLDRAANAEKGKAVFLAKCQSCHGAYGQGQMNHDSSFYIYPPLWGPNSYNTAAGIFRISRFASYVKNNMPFGTSHRSPRLSDEEAWDVAAYVNSQPRPQKFFDYDWPKLEKKPVDFPFGPYADNFTDIQHKYGPFKPIIDAKKNLVKK